MRIFNKTKQSFITSALVVILAVSIWPVFPGVKRVNAECPEVPANASVSFSYTRNGVLTSYSNSASSYNSVNESVVVDEGSIVEDITFSIGSILDYGSAEYPIGHVITYDTNNQPSGGSNGPFTSNAILASNSGSNHIRATAGQGCNGASATIDLYLDAQPASSPAYSLLCGVNQTVDQGTDANYVLQAILAQANGLGINVTMASSPSGPTMNTSPVILNQGNNYTSTATIPTGALSPGTYTLTFTPIMDTFVSSGTPCSANLTVNAVVVGDAVDLKFNGSDGPQNNPVLINDGDTGVLSWTNSTVVLNNYVCTATSNPGTTWNGTRSKAINTTLTEDVGPLSGPQTYSFELACAPTVGDGPTYSDTVYVSVAAPQQLQVDLKFNGQDAPANNPVVINNGDSGTLSWVTDLASTYDCTAFSTPTTTWDGERAPTTKGSSEDVGPLSGAQTYMFELDCSPIVGEAPTYFDQVYVSVGPGGVTADIKCEGAGDTSYKDGSCLLEYGNAGSVSWSSTNANSCTVTSPNPPGFSEPSIKGDPGTSNAGVSSGNILTTPTVFTLECVGDTGSSSDTITFVLSNYNPSFDMNCVPITATISPGDSYSFDINTVSVQGYDGTVTMTGEITPVDGSGPVIDSYTNNNAVPSSTTTALITTSSKTPAQTYTITFLGTGNSGLWQGVSNTCVVELTVADGTISSPIQVTTDNSICGQITVGWKPAKGGADPSYYRVYRKGSLKDSWSQIGTVNFDASISYSYTDTDPFAGSSNYYAVSAVSASNVESDLVEPTTTPVGLNPCAPNLTLSDKDIVSVSGKLNKAFDPSACSSTSDIAGLPSNALFSPGDIITYQINVCNSGSAPLTNVTILDTISNLSSPADFQSPVAGCLGDVKQLDDTTIFMTLKDIPAKPENSKASSCDITFTAVVTAPVTTNSSLYRFQNIADIYAAEISADPVNYPLGYYRVLTPPYLFTLGGGVPTRSETSPH